eukprot:TRINITY_DN1150_c0_g1_i10.p2 TRINITY_DN1150_c0_g1~~TRINITY_DN1150_c0_g1_i10.p2  ORF type:complete len:100 (+),score=5.37 TRINITY_DN1150_c0_g1_i10:301-600(+)
MMGPLFGYKLDSFLHFLSYSSLVHVQLQHICDGTFFQLEQLYLPMGLLVDYTLNKSLRFLSCFVQVHVQLQHIWCSTATHLRWYIFPTRTTISPDESTG